MNTKDKRAHKSLIDNLIEIYSLKVFRYFDNDKNIIRKAYLLREFFTSKTF